MKKEEILSISQKLEELYFSLRQAEAEGKLSGRDDRVQLKEDEKEAIQKVLNFLEQNPDLASDTGLSDVDLGTSKRSQSIGTVRLQPPSASAECDPAIEGEI